MVRRNSRWPCNFKCYFWFLYNSTLSISILILIFLVIFRPEELKFTITDASLARFVYNSTGNSTLNYNLALNITIRNPKKKVGVYFNRIQVLSHYGKKRFSMVTLSNSTPFYQGRKNTTIVKGTIEGQQVVLFKRKEVDMYIAETIVGIYSLEMKLAVRVKARYGKIKSSYYKTQKKSCKLKLPLLNTTTNGTSPNANGAKV